MFVCVFERSAARLCLSDFCSGPVEQKGRILHYLLEVRLADFDPVFWLLVFLFDFSFS